MAKPIGKRPENFWKTLRTLLHYMGNRRFLLLAVAVLVSLSALANLLGTYMLKPIVNDYIIPRDVNGLIHAVALTACIYGAGVLSAYGSTQIMVVVAQKIVCEIREDLFHRMQSFPLRYSDTIKISPPRCFAPGRSTTPPPFMLSGWNRRMRTWRSNSRQLLARLSVAERRALCFLGSPPQRRNLL